MRRRHEFPRRSVAWLGCLALLATTVVGAAAWFDGSSRGSALGPVQAITPVQTFPNLWTGLEPDLSRRGEAVAAMAPGDGTPGDLAFIGLDNVAIEAPFDGDHIGVSGNGCVAAYVVDGPPPPVVIRLTAAANLVAQAVPAGLTRIATVDRCDPTNSRTLADVKTDEGPFGQPVLDFDGSVVVVPMSTRIVRFDIGTAPATSELPLTSISEYRPALEEASYGNSVDVSADGSVVVASLLKGCTTVVAACSSNTVVVSWRAGAATVDVVSTPDGTPGGMALSPSVSGDGSFVSFVSFNRLSGQPADQHGPWVYVRPIAAPQFRQVSPVDQIARFSSLSEDGTQVAFVRQAKSCEATIVIPGCVPNPKQIVTVAFSSTPGLTGPFQTEDVNQAPGGIAGDHRAPVLSGNGRYVAWETSGGAALLGDPDFSDEFHTVMRQRDASFTVDGIPFGSIAAGTSLTRTTTVTNTGRSSILPSEILTGAAQFVVTGGTCNGFAWIPPGATCTVDVRFDAPLAGGPSEADLIVREVGFQPLTASGRLTGTSTPSTDPTTTPPTDPTTTPPTDPTTTPPPVVTPDPIPEPTPTVILTAVPNPVAFGPAATGIPTAVVELTVTNSGNTAGPIQLFVTGPHATDFEVVSDSCRVIPLAAGADCVVRLRMLATAGGDRTAILDVISGSASVQVPMSGQGRLAPQLAASPATITQRGFTTIIGQGFLPDESVSVAVQPSSVVLPAVADAAGTFQIPLSAFGQLPLGSYELVVAARPDAYDEVRAGLLVALSTFQPQGPTSAVFGNNLLVARGN